MSQAFVWFHNSSKDPGETAGFYESLVGWNKADGPMGMTMLAGEEGPLAAVAAEEPGISGWVPFIRVDDVDAATKKATGLGAKVLKEKTRGPAGEFSILKDPGGAAVAVWQKA